MAMLIAGRSARSLRFPFLILTPLIVFVLAIQGLGAGANQAMTEIIVSDLVPVAERGMFFGIIGM
jgi:MFS family permease